GEHVVARGTRVAPARPAHPYAETEKVGCPEVGRDRAQAVMSGEAAAEACLQPTGLEVDLVVDDEDGVGLELVEARSCADGPAALVHERLRLEQRDPVTVDPHLRQPAGEFPLPRRSV